jgi:hypothetical protein
MLPTPPFPASEEAALITGMALVIDGGQSLVVGGALEYE